MKTTFNRNPLVYGKTMEQPSANDLKNTFGLWNASWDDAVGRRFESVWSHQYEKRITEGIKDAKNS